MFVSYIVWLNTLICFINLPSTIFFPTWIIQSLTQWLDIIYRIKDSVNFVFRPFYLHWLSYCLPKSYNKWENVILNATLLKALNVQLNALTLNGKTKFRYVLPCFDSSLYLYQKYNTLQKNTRNYRNYPKLMRHMCW